MIKLGTERIAHNLYSVLCTYSSRSTRIAEIPVQLLSNAYSCFISNNNIRSITISGSNRFRCARPGDETEASPAIGSQEHL